MSPCATSMRKPAHAAVEPEAKDAVELVADVRVPPVEVGLLRRELVQVVALAVVVVRPMPSRR